MCKCSFFNGYTDILLLLEHHFFPPSHKKIDGKTRVKEWNILSANIIFSEILTKALTSASQSDREMDFLVKRGAIATSEIPIRFCDHVTSAAGESNCSSLKYFIV